MNIAMVSEHASPLAVLGGVDAGGQNVHVAELAAALARSGRRVTVYTRRDDPKMPRRVTMPSGVVVEHVDAGPARPVAKDELFPFMDSFAAHLRAAFAREGYDVVHAHFWMSAYAALTAAAPLGIPVVQTFHALGTEKRRMQGAADGSPAQRLAVERAIVAQADRIVATSSSEVFELCRLGADPRRLKIVPCGVDLGLFDAQPGTLALPRRRRFRIATLSRLVERKGVGDVIAALRDVPDAELVVGGGPAPAELGADAEAQRLTQQALACGVADRVTLLGRIERRDVPRFLRAADVVVCAAWYEPFGIVPLEAMAASRPVIATAVGGQNDTVIDRFTGLHVQPRRPAALAAALREILDAPRWRESLGQAGRARVAARFTWDRIAIETLKVYRGLERRGGDAAVSHTA